MADPKIMDLLGGRPASQGGHGGHRHGQHTAGHAAAQLHHRGEHGPPPLPTNPGGGQAAEERRRLILKHLPHGG
jgi:hypothetical protein